MTLKERFENKIFYSPDGCWYWIGAKLSSGYGVYCIYKSRKHIRAHRLSYTIYKGEISENIVVCHRCDNKLCVNPDHLFLGTQKDNMCDMIKKGRQNYHHGANHRWTKLTENDVLFIRSSRMTAWQLVKIFPFVTTGAIYGILKKQSWKHI